VIPLFRWSGGFVGFFTDGCLFDANGRYFGWEDRAGRVWRSDGRYLGERVDQHYVLRRVAWATPVPQPRRVPPVIPELPLPPPHRTARPPRPGWEDALGRVGLLPAPQDLVGDWRSAQDRIRFLADGRYTLLAAGRPHQHGSWELRGNLYLTPDLDPDPPATPGVRTDQQPGAAPPAAPRRLVFRVLAFDGRSIAFRQVTEERSLPFTLERDDTPA
jgi:hypothetical protein